MFTQEIIQIFSNVDSCDNNFISTSKRKSVQGTVPDAAGGHIPRGVVRSAGASRSADDGDDRDEGEE